MRFIINIVCFLFLLPLIATAQTYKYIGVENGLSNRRIFDIQKDSIGYMWFLTNEGIDRYNGKDIKHYKLRWVLSIPFFISCIRQQNPLTVLSKII
ncbi:hypothetical protein AAH120_00005, partial [Bacteroides uniformis]